MGKVVTSQGLNEFVQSGKFETVEADKPPVSTQAPLLEVKKEQAPQDVKADENDTDHPETDPVIKAAIETSEELRKAVARKSYALRKAEEKLAKIQEEAAESERFSEQQYNRARMAEEQLARAQKALDEANAEKAKTTEPASVKAPDKNDPKYVVNGQFDWDTYIRDTSEYTATLKVAEFQKSQEEAYRVKMAQEREAKARALVDATKAKHSDYDEKVAVMMQANHPIHTDVKEYMEESPQLGELIYYFANHPDFIERINKLTPKRAVAAVRDIERAFEQPAPVKEPEAPVQPQKAVSGAPPPITPLPTSASVNVNTDPSKMDFKQLRAFERERSKRRS